MANVVRENISPLIDKLTVTLTKEDYYPNFEKKLKEYSKQANVPGFRKGMVPAGMIKKMYGQGIFGEEVLRTVDTKIYDYLVAENPQIFAQPLPLPNEMSKLDMNNPTDISFAFEIGLKSAFDFPNFATAKLTKNNVEVTDAMLNEEIERMQEKAGGFKDADSITDKTVKIDALCKVDDSEVLKEQSFFVNQFNDATKASMLGKKVGDATQITLAEAIKTENVTAIEKQLNVPADFLFTLTINKISETEKAALNEDFFNQVFPNKGITTVEALKAELITEMKQYWASQTMNQLHDQLYHLLLDETKIEFPQAFLKRWLQQGGDKPKTAEEAEAEYPTFEGQLKWTMISDKIISENKLEVAEADLRKAMQDEVSKYFGGMNFGDDTGWLDSYIDRMMKDEKQVDATYRRLITEKVFDWAVSQSKPVEKTVTVDELVGMQHKH
jgi:trigger factor